MIQYMFVQHKLDHWLNEERGRLTERMAELDSITKVRADNRQLRAELSCLSEKLDMQEKAIDKLYEELTQRHKLVDDTKLVEAENEVSQQDEPTVVRMDDVLRERINKVFKFTNSTDQTVEDNDAYDFFMKNCHEDERLAMINRIYAAAHEGQHLMPCALKKFNSLTKRSRVGKRSFSACLRAMGGIQKKSRDLNANVWCNVSMVE